MPDAECHLLSLSHVNGAGEDNRSCVASPARFTVGQSRFPREQRSTEKNRVVILGFATLSITVAVPTSAARDSRTVIEATGSTSSWSEMPPLSHGRYERGVKGIAQPLDEFLTHFVAQRINKNIGGFAFDCAATDLPVKDLIVAHHPFDFKARNRQSLREALGALAYDVSIALASLRMVCSSAPIRSAVRRSCPASSSSVHRS